MSSGLRRRFKEVQRQEKEAKVGEMRSSFARAASMFLTRYSGMNVGAIHGLRGELRRERIRYQVVKNTLARLAVKGTPMQGLSDLFVGPIAVAYSHEDPLAPARLLTAFAKRNDRFSIVAGFLDGQVLNPADVDKLAKMPGKPELRAMLLGALMAVPRKFVGTLAAAPRGFMGVLTARREQIEKQG